MSELTDKQEKYCQSYVVCGNQSAAYRMAFEADAMNVNTVAVEACRLHSDPNITLRIKEIQKEAYERNKITIDEIIKSLAGMVRFDIADLYDEEEGRLKPLHEMPKEARLMIQHLETDEIMLKGTVIGYTKKLRTYSKLDAIEKLMKHLGGYEKDNQQSKAVTNVTLSLGSGVKPEGD